MRAMVLAGLVVGALASGSPAAAAESRGLFGISGRMAGNPAPPKPSKQQPAQIFPAGELWSGRGKVLGGTKSWSYQAIERTADGAIEVHDGWNDIFMVQDGRATLVTGGVVTGAQDQGQGEHRGGTRTGDVRRQAIGPGDVIFIPAGLPHQMVLGEAGGRIRYLAIKTRP